MNCDQLLQVTSWECTPSGTRSVRAVSPFTLGNDGRHAAFYLASPTDDTFYLTDGGETAMHAAQSGIELTKARIEQLNRTPVSDSLISAETSQSPPKGPPTKQRWRFGTQSSLLCPSPFPARNGCQRSIMCDFER